VLSVRYEVNNCMQCSNINLNVCHPRCINTIRNNDTVRLYTTPYYCNPKTYMFRLYETVIIRLQVSEIYKRKAYNCVCKFNSIQHRRTLSLLHSNFSLDGLIDSIARANNSTIPRVVDPLY